jgi:hypothetical protein
MVLALKFVYDGAVRPERLSGLPSTPAMASSAAQLRQQASLS